MSRMKSVALTVFVASLLMGLLFDSAVAINKPVSSNVDTHLLVTTGQSKGQPSSTALDSPTEVWVDDSWNNQGDVDLYNPSLIFGYDAFNTIQGGIDGVSGSTVHILSGTYIENITVNKSVELSGAGAGSCFVYPLLSAPMPGAGSSLPDGASNLVLVQANDVTISGLTLDGDNPGLTSGVVVGGADLDARNGIITDHRIGIFNNLEIYEVTVKNIYLRGIYASSGGTFNFHYNTVQNVNGEANSIGIFNFGGSGFFDHNVVSDCNDAISSNHSKGCQFTYNTVTNSSSGIHTDNAGDAGGTADLIENNSVSNSPAGGYGIWVFVPYIAPLVNSNTISNVEIGLTYACSYSIVTPRFTNNIVDGMGKSNSTGLYVTTESWWWDSGDVTSIFENNYIIGNTDGAYIVAEAGFTNTLTLFNNSISGNANSNITNGTGAYGAGTFAINASGNWWGSNVPVTIAASLSSGIDYTPWFDTGADTGDPGFQGDFNALWVDDDSPQSGTVGRIQEALDAILSGGTVSVLAGTYIDNLIVAKPMILLGAGIGFSLVYPSLSAPNPGGAGSLPPDASNMVLVQAHNVSITGFTFDGDNPSLTSGVVAGGADLDARNGIITNHPLGLFNNLTVDHCAVRNIYLRGIYASSGGTFNFHHNIVDNVQGETASIGVFNFYGAGVFDHNTVSNCNDAIASNWSSGCTFTYNDVTNSGSGIHTDNAGNAVGSTADLIENNNISNSRVNGYGIFVFAPYLAPVINLNTITNVDVGLTCAGSYVSVTPQFTNNTVNGMGKANSAGVYVTTEIWGYTSGNVSVHFENNTISNLTEGVYLVGETGKTNSTTLLNNNILQNGLGISNGVGLTFGGGPNVGAVVSATQNTIANTVNATDNKAGNTYTQNCWSDWSGVGAYYVGGGGGNIDNNPSLHCGMGLCGDADGSSNVDISDAVYLIAYIFSGGTAPNPLGLGDATCDNIVDISDVVYLIAYIFSGGLAPCAACE
ncbi:MAG: hypothetical protein E4G91_03815 [Candidatus Zixiibacteriota bacterium]|nr:MAG: hypothetical protein E4G91_03815 [candidate division Zixibacteria bacterium]